MFKFKLLSLSLLAFLAMANINSQAQNWKWAKRIKTIAIGNYPYDSWGATAIDNLGNIYTAEVYQDTIVADTIHRYPTGWAYNGVFISKHTKDGKIQWLHTVTSASSGQQAYVKDIVVDNGGNSYIAGYFTDTLKFDSGYKIQGYQTGGFGQNAFLAKFDANGNILWATALGGYSCVGNHLALDRLGNIFLTGHFSGTFPTQTDTLSTSANWDMFIAKLDNHGTLQWIKQSISHDLSGDCDGTSVTVDERGNCIVIGNVNSPNHDSISFGSYTFHVVQVHGIYITKYDPNGNVRWSNAYSPLGSTLYGSDVGSDHSDNIYVTGNYGGSYVSFNVNYLPYQESVYLVKYDSTGNFQWVHTGGNTGGETSRGISVTDEGDCYITGNLETANAPFDNLTVSCAGGKDGYIAKYRADGTIAWIIQSKSNQQEQGASVAVNNKGEGCVLGTYDGEAILGNDTLQGNSNHNYFLSAFQDNQKPYLTKINPDSAVAGQMVTTMVSSKFTKFTQSTSILVKLQRGGSSVQATSVNVINDSTVQASFFIPLSVPLGLYDVEVISVGPPLSNQGSFWLDDAFKILKPNVSTSLKENIIEGIQVFPNPFQSQTIITIPNADNAEIRIWDIYGRKIIDLMGINHPTTIIEGNQFKSGMYFYTVLQNNNVLLTGKLIKE